MPLLDPRPEAVARAEPFEEAANIPLDTIAQRPHELPAPGAAVLVARCDEAEAAIRVLQDMKRTAEIAEPSQADLFRQTPLWTPNATLVRVAGGLTPGRALDLGCGGGRDAVWLATQGWTVTAIDHLPDALDRVEDLAHRYAPEGSVRTKVADLGRETPEGEFKLAWMAYGLFESAFRGCRSQVKALETFAPCHRERYGKPGRVLSLETCRRWSLGEEILGEEGWRGDRCTVRFAAVVWSAGL